MRKMLLLLSVFICMGMVLSAAARMQKDGEQPAFANDRIKIKLTTQAKNLADLPQDLNTEKTSFGIRSLDEKMARNGGNKLKRAHRRVNDTAWEQTTGFDRWFIIMLDGSTDVQTALADFLTDPSVEDASLEYYAYTQVAPNDPYYSSNWGHNNTAQLPVYVSGSGHAGAGVGTIGWDSDAQLAWDQTQGYGSASIIIAIIDSGVDTAHPDLRLVTGYDYGDNDSNPMDDSADPGHGTSCSGIAAAIANNNLGVTGIAGGCSIMPLKIADSAGDMDFTAIENALTHAADNGAHVISMSFGAEGGAGEGDIPTTDAALEYAYDAGVVMFAATANANTSAIAYPSNHNKVISVGASSPCGQRKSTSSCDGETWWGSNYGVNTQDDQESVDIMAPTILPATDITGAGNGYDTSSDYYMWFNGTSCSTPYAAGVAALILSLNPTLTPAEVWTIMKNSATDMTIDGGAGWDRYTGYGMVNAYQALLQIQDPAVITWDPTSFYQELTTGATGSQNLTIGNTGEMVLNYTLSKQMAPASFPADGFESYTNFAISFAPWTLVDVDQSTTYGITNYTWANAGSAQAYIVFTPSATTPAISIPTHAGSKMAACFASVTPPNNDWLISPLITPVSGDLLEFYAKSYTSSYGLERFKVGISSGGTAPGDFTIISGANYIEAPVDWTYYYYDLSSYAGQNIRFAIQCVSNYAFIFFVDDVSVSSGESYTPSWLTLNSGNTVTGTVDGVAKDTDVIAVGFNSTGLAAGTYTTSLSLTSNSGSNPSISIPVTLQVEEPLPVQLSSFTAAISADNYVNLTWVTQTETGVQGFYVLRNSNEELATATTVSELIQATNTSQQQTYIFTDAEIQEDGTYYYWLQNSDLDGTVDYHGPISIAYAAVGSGTPSIPLVTSLAPAYPNPFNPSTTLSYSLAEPAPVVIDIYNQRGQLVRSYHKEHSAPGQFSLAFDGRDRNGVPLSSGVYLYRMSAGTFSQFRKMVLCK
jgi:subtilisin family serine protease